MFLPPRGEWLSQGCPLPHGATGMSMNRDSGFKKKEVEVDQLTVMWMEDPRT